MKLEIYCLILCEIMVFMAKKINKVILVDSILPNTVDAGLYLHNAKQVRKLNVPIHLVVIAVIETSSGFLM